MESENSYYSWRGLISKPERDNARAGEGIDLPRGHWSRKPLEANGRGCRSRVNPTVHWLLVAVDGND